MGFVARASACALLISTLPLAGQETPRGESFADLLHHILRASADRFRQVEGARIENRRREHFFEAKVYLPDASYCRIFDQGVTVYCCEWNGKAPAATSSFFDATVAQTVNSLGPDWTPSARKDGAGRDVVFTGPGKPVVHIMLRASPPQVYLLVLPKGSPSNGFIGTIPRIEGFVRP